MSEEFYSIGRGSLNLNGKFYYGLDYAITDFMRNLEKENRHLETNWNELKNYLILCSNFGTKEETYQYEHILNKMQELERGKDE